MADISVRSIDMSDVPEELAKAIQPIILKWETAALKVAAGHHPEHPKSWQRGSAEDLLSQRFSQLPAIVKTSAKARSDTLLASAKFSGRVERLVGIDALAADRTPAEAPLAKLTGDETKRLLSFAAGLAPSAARVAPTGTLAPVVAEPTTWDKLSLQFIRVACIDETNGWGGSEWGSDEISVGGALLDTDGRTNKVPPIDLGGDWDDGDVRDFQPPKSILGYSLRGGLTFPRSIFVTLVLIERDGSGMQDIINGIVEKISQEAKTALTALLAAAAGAAVGGPVGLLIGLAVGYAIDKIVGKIRNLWNDVAFIPKTIQANIPSRQAMFAGRRTSGSDVVRFLGPGEYACRYQWQLSDIA